MRRTNDRTGFTLLEMLATMSIGSVLMLLAIAWIGETMKFASRTANHRHQHQQLTQLGRNFRNDVRLSQSMTMDDDRRLVLQGDDGRRITYSISGTTIEMEKFSDSQVSRERYPLVAGSVIEWDTSGMPDSIGLIVLRSQLGATALAADPDAAASRERNADNLKEPDPIPIDIHIIVQVNRWGVQSLTENRKGGTR